jgi:hypothetical protein
VINPDWNTTLKRTLYDVAVDEHPLPIIELSQRGLFATPTKRAGPSSRCQTPPAAPASK